MKKEIHPVLNDVVFIDSNSSAKFYSKSVRSSDEVEETNGKKYFVIRVEVTSDTHPFYTGKGNIIDQTGRVEKFNKRREKATR